MKLNYIFFSLGLALLTGCQSSPEKDARGAGPAVPAVNVQQSLDKVEVEIVDELRLLAKLRSEQRYKDMSEDEKRQRILQANTKKIPDELKKHSSMHIPPKEAHEVCSMISDAIGYDSTVVGPMPRKPIWVSIKIRDEPIYSAVQELGRQTGSAFTMEIYSNSKLVRCVYNREVNG